MNADEILVMDHGRIGERGSHQQLLARGDTYARMWRLQKEEEAHQEPSSPSPTSPVLAMR